MKRTLLIAFVAVLMATQTFAFGGSIGVFTAAGATSCTVIKPALGQSFQPVVVHTGFDGSTGSAFQALIPPCTGLVHVVDISQVNILLGNTQIGASAAYGECVTGGLKAVVNMFVSVVGLTPDDCTCFWVVTRHPDLPGVTTPISTDCAQSEEPAAGGTAFVKDSGGITQCDCNVPTRDSTWGSVKELFRTDI